MIPVAARNGVATVTLDRPERKNPLTFATPSCATRSARCVYADDVKAVVSPAPAAISARAATCTRSSARWSRWTCRSCSTFTRMTGDLVKAMRALPAADHRRDRRRVRRRRRDHRHGLRPAARHAAREDRVPVHPRRPRRLRHGRLRDAAAHHRPGPRRRTALHRPRDAAARRASAGASSTAWSRPRRCSTRRRRWPRELAAGPTFAHAMTKTQLDQEWAMAIDAGDRGRGPGAGDLHADRGLRPRLRGLRGQARSRCSRATEMRRPRSLSSTGRSSSRATARFAERAAKPGARRAPAASTHARRRRRLPRRSCAQLGAAGWLRHRGRRHGGAPSARRRAPCA